MAKVRVLIQVEEDWLRQFDEWLTNQNVPAPRAAVMRQWLEQRFEHEKSKD